MVRGSSRGRTGRRGRTGGRGHSESQDIVSDLNAHGLTADEARKALKGMGFSVSRISQLMKGYKALAASNASAASSSHEPSVSIGAAASEAAGNHEHQDGEHEEDMGFHITPGGPAKGGRWGKEILSKLDSQHYFRQRA